MKLSLKNQKFRRYCRHMYDENWQERWSHGQRPYESMEIYVEKNLAFLINKYEQLDEQQNAIY